ncbi:MFS transporter [Streptomyces sp. NPDC046557]|uniref:MFS transporter n=1 Tax=Streptomyces sp. NPDC046557 TaxID=3155372 RepID=UPI0034039EA9
MSTFTAYRRVLSGRLFRRYFLGESLSGFGDAMSEVTVVVFAMRLAHGDTKPIAIALASAAYLVPGIATSMPAARRIARVRSRTLLLIDSGWRGGVLGAAALLALFDGLDLAGYLILLGLASLTRPLAGAGARAMTRELVEPQMLFTANTLLANAVQGASMVGPALAGLLISLTDAGLVLGIDALSFLFYSALLLTLPGGPHEPQEPQGETHARARVGEGPRRRRLLGGGLRDHPDVLGLFVLAALFLLLYGPFVVGLPLIAQERAGGRSAESVLGGLWAAFGIGAVLGNLLVGARRSSAHGRYAALIAAAWGAVTVVVAVPTHLAVAWAAMLVGGLIYAPFPAIISTVMQQHLPERHLKEAGAYYVALTSTFGPLGTLLGGILIASVSAGTGLAVDGALLVMVGLAMAWLLRTDAAPAVTPDAAGKPAA